MKASRRDFIKSTAAAIALSNLYGSGSKAEAAIQKDKKKMLEGAKSFKAPCRFCGTGCGVLVHVKEGQIVMTEGDPLAPVNKGFNCIKGYNLSKVLYGDDRILQPMIRKGGKLRTVSWEEALDYIVGRMNLTLKEYGPKAIAMAGSGQWTIQEGYTASKFMKAGIKSNNIDPNARYCMASAVGAFMRTFKSDEPMGCYADFEHADAFVTWGANMAEMHPVLFSRLSARMYDHGAVLYDLGTRHTRTSDEANLFLLFKPQTDLAIANAIANYIVSNDLHDKEFVNEHTTIKMAQIEPGYGIDPISAPHLQSLEESQKGRKNPKGGTPMSFEEYKNFLSYYTFDRASEISGVPAGKIEKLAKLYADPTLKVMSLWTMGFNQHTRGVWANHLVYNIHLLMGKIAKPGNSPFSLTGQPSACGTAREVGTFAHRLPADMVVMNKDHRKKAAKIWFGDESRFDDIPSKPGTHLTKMMREFERGNLKVLWVQCCNPFASSPNTARFKDRSNNKDSMLIVSDSYRSTSTDLADVVLPTAMWVEKEGMYGNAERRGQHWFQAVEPPGESRDDMWQILAVAEKMGMKSLLWDKNDPTRFEKCFEEYRKFTIGTGKDLAPYSEYIKARGFTWPVTQDKDGTWKETMWRYNAEYDPYARKALGGKKKGIKFYKRPDGKAIIWCCPYEPAPEEPDHNYPFWLCTGRILEHWHTGTMTRRIPALHRAAPYSKIELYEDDAKKLGIQPGDKVRVSSRRGSKVFEAEINGRGRPQRGMVFVAFFDENNQINDLTLDVFDPISKEPDYKKCAVSIQKV